MRRLRTMKPFAMRGAMYTIIKPTNLFSRTRIELTVIIAATDATDQQGRVNDVVRIETHPAVALDYG